MKITHLILTIIFICILQAADSYSQELLDDPIPSNESGEIHSSVTNVMRIRATETGERLFVIFRRGSVDTLKTINAKRMRESKFYILDNNGFDPQKVIFAEGEPIKGEGRIEYYLGSNLQFIVFAPKNKVPNFTCCMDYFPPPKRKAKKKRIRN